MWSESDFLPFGIPISIWTSNDSLVCGFDPLSLSSLILIPVLEFTELSKYMGNQTPSRQEELIFQNGTSPVMKNWRKAKREIQLTNLQETIHAYGIKEIIQ